MTLQEAGQAVGILTATTYAVKWLVGFYFKKANELEKMKSDYRTGVDTQIEKNISDMRAAVTVFRQELNDIKVKISEHNGQLRENTRMMEMSQKQWERTAEKLEDRYAALDGAEVVKVGENTFIFKTRRS